MSRPFTESVVEEAALFWLADLGYAVIEGDLAAPDGPAPERHAFRDAVLEERLRLSLKLLNPSLPGESIVDAAKWLARPPATWPHPRTPSAREPCIA